MRLFFAILLFDNFRFRGVAVGSVFVLVGISHVAAIIIDFGRGGIVFILKVSGVFASIVAEKIVKYIIRLLSEVLI